MEQSQEIFNKLKGIRIWIPIFIGLGISLFLLISNLNNEHFVEIHAGEVGTHIWKDVNHNGKVDFWNVHEFVKKPAGNYRLMQLKDILAEINWTFYSILWLGLAICMMILRDVAYMLRIRILTDKQLSWKQSFFVIMIWEFASALTPGVVGGSAVAMFILNREKISMGRSTAIVITTALMDNLFFVIMVPILFFSLGSSSLFNAEKDIIDDGIMYLFWSGYALIFLICLILFLGIFIFPNLILRLLNGITHLSFLKRFRRRANRTGIDVRITAQQFKSYSFIYWLKVFGATFLSWTGRYFVINCLLVAFLPLTFAQSLFIFAKQFIMWVLMLVSPTPGASGVAEWAFSNLLSEFAPSLILLIALAIIWRLISYFPYLFIGAILLPRWLNKKN